MAEERRTPGGPEELSPRSWFADKRTVKAFQDDNIGDWAAALTYYGSSRSSRRCWRWCRPWAIGPSATQPLIDNLETVAPGPASDIVTGAIRDIQKGQDRGHPVRGLAGGGALVRLGLRRSFHARLQRRLRRRGGTALLKRRLPTRVLLTVVLLALVAVIAVAVTFTGPLAEQAGNLLGIGSEALAARDIASGP